MKRMLKRLTLLAATIVAAASLLAGCSGDDGAAGANGLNGTNGKDVAVTPAEACAACHGGGAASVDTVHASSSNGDIAVSAIDTSTSTATDLIIKFNVKINGSNKSTYYDAYGGDGYRLRGDTLAREAVAGITLVSNGSGNYTATIPNGVTTNAGVNSRYLFYVKNTADAALASASRPAGYRAYITFDYPAAPIADLLGSSAACADCHGSFGNGFHRGAPSYGGKTCTVCHDASNTTYPRTVAMVHGIHNSANMPLGKFSLPNLAVPPRTWEYSIAFPSYLDNCSICHQTGAPLTAANSKPVSYDFCMTCHQNWDGFGANLPAAHKSYTTATNCNACHSADPAMATVGGMHNAAEMSTGNGGLLYDGVDVGVVEGAKITQKITGVTRTGDKLAITWTATYNGAAVDPCNATPSATAPSFAHKQISLVDHGAVTVVDHNFSFLKGFFTGDDVTNANNGNSSPGQPNSTNVDFTSTGNTACAANVATTTLTLTAKEALLTGKGRIGLQGKPVMKHTATDKLFYVRAKSPIYDYNLADGTAAAVRRPVADTDKCLKCHVGSLYQHGGNRIDSVELCVMCHNEASSDQNNRVAMGVDATEAYDGKVGQTYGFKSMLHAVHASGEAGQKPLVIYRTRGIYAFAPSEADMPSTWPGASADKTLVYGGDPAVAAAMQPHNFLTAHYPRNLNDCSACHPSTFSSIADQSKAVATTVNAGAAPWDNQLDDTLMGATTAACTGCHRSDIVKLHTEKEGFIASILEAGRQTIIDLFK
ncbi:MAG: hypothetical protein PHF56_10805 [Desulfuromonadaceae bacterium]|nr:hypothetical protein [Desulfuromonadaceae bacterium]